MTKLPDQILARFVIHASDHEYEMSKYLKEKWEQGYLVYDHSTQYDFKTGYIFYSFVLRRDPS